MPQPQKDKLGRYRFQFLDPTGTRRSLSLGVVKERYAIRFGRYLDDLIASRRSGVSPDADLLTWLKEVDESILEKFVAWNLLTGDLKRRCGAGKTLEELTTAFIAHGKQKQSTKVIWGRAKNHLHQFFGPESHIKPVTLGRAKEFRDWLPRGAKRPLADATVRKTISLARQMWDFAIDHEWIEKGKNPFDDKDLPTNIRSNKSRKVYVDVELVRELIDACPNNDWKLIIALNRFAGLRCPSEVKSLLKANVDWDRSRMTIISPKTEHFEGKETREIPIFAEVRPYLKACCDALPRGEKFVLPFLQHYRVDTNGSINIWTPVSKIMKRAGIKRWPKLFQNLRSSAETDLTDRFPGHVVCEWIGNSEKVAREPYLHVKNQHFEAAAQNSCAQVVQSGMVSGNQPFQEAKKTPGNRNKRASVTTREKAGKGIQWPLQDSNL